MATAEKAEALEHPLFTFSLGWQGSHPRLEISFHRSWTIHCEASAFAAHMCASGACPPLWNHESTTRRGGRDTRTYVNMRKVCKDLSLGRLLYRDVIYFGYLNAG